MIRAVEPLPEAPADDVTRELLARIHAGERAAGDDLYRRHHDAMLLAVRARLGTRLRGFMESEDVLQSAALEAFQSLPGFEPRGAGSLGRWLHQIVVNKIRDQADRFQAAKRDAGFLRGDSALETLAEPQAAAACYHDERYEKLERAIALLPDDMRDMLVLRRFDGLSSREAALRVGCSDAAARQLYSRALARLAVHMGGREM